MSTKARLHFLPGLGADARLFAPQQVEWPDAHFWALPAPCENDTLASYAERWAGSYAWQKNDLVVGFAFGGILALEAASRHAGFRSQAGGIVLVSSCRTSAAVTKGFRQQVALSKMIPGMVMRRMLQSFAERFSPEDDLTDEQRQYLRDMATELDLDHLRWASAQCCDWEMGGTSDIEKELPVFQIHGERDSVIPLVPGDVDLTIPNAGHLIQYTHSGELDAYIRKCVARLGLELG